MGTKGTRIQPFATSAAPDIDLQDLLNGLQDEIVVIDSRYRVRWANSAALSRLNRDIESPVGMLCYEVLYGRDRPCAAPFCDCPLEKLLNHHGLVTGSYPICNLDTESQSLLFAYPLRDSDDNATAIVEVRRKTSPDRGVEALLKQYHQLEVLNRISSAANGIQDLREVLNISLDSILEVFKAAAGGILLLHRASGTLSYYVHRRLAADHLDEIRIPLGEGITGKTAKTGEPIIIDDVSRDRRVLQSELPGVERFRGCITVPLTLKRRKEIAGAIVIVSDVAGSFDADDVALLSSISDFLGAVVIRSGVDAKIHKGMQRYQVLLRYALNAQEDERKRLARELHDETSQALASLTFRLQAAIQMAEAEGFGDARFRDVLERAHSSAVQTGNEIVKLMMDLRPTLLDDLGMPAAIYRYAKDTLETRGIRVNVEFTGGEPRLPAEVEVAFFRVAQGLISNILKHSHAKNVSIRVELNARKAILYIEDDGIGFDAEKFTEVEPSGRGAGLFTMRERLRIVGGTARIESRPGQGTKVTVTVPIVKGLEDLADISDEQDKGDDR